jgi:hypothetical protein
MFLTHKFVEDDDREQKHKNKNIKNNPQLLNLSDARSH